MSRLLRCLSPRLKSLNSAKVLVAVLVKLVSMCLPLRWWTPCVPDPIMAPLSAIRLLLLTMILPLWWIEMTAAVRKSGTDTCKGLVGVC